MQPLWKVIQRFLKKLNGNIIWSNNPTPEYISRKKKKQNKTLFWKDTSARMLTATLFIIAKIWKLPKCPSTEEWIKKIWYTHTQKRTQEYYSAIKKENLPFATPWMDLEGIMHSEIIQTEKDKHSTLSLTWEYKK